MKTQLRTHMLGQAKLLFLFLGMLAVLFLFPARRLLAATTTVNLTTADSDGIAWASGTWSMIYMAPTGWSPVAVLINNQPFTQYFSGTLDSTGSFTQAGVPDVNSMYPTGGTWRVNVCPNLYSNTTFCTVVSIPITGITENISALVNATLPKIRSIGGPLAQGYSDVEISQIAGSMYFNIGTTTPGFRCYTNVWAACFSGGDGGGGTTTYAVTFNSSGAGSASPVSFNGAAAATISYNTIGADAAGAAAAVLTTSLQKSNNLSDLASAATARTNLGLGTSATTAASAYAAAASATATGLASTIGALTGCATANYAWVPQSNTCVYVGGGSDGISGLTAGYIPLAGTATTLTGNSHLDDGVTTAGTITSSEPLAGPSWQGTGTTPTVISLPAGTGTPPNGLPANSAGFIAPVTGGTAYAFKLPATITAGVLAAAAPATGVDGVNESSVTSKPMVGTDAGIMSAGTVSGSAGTPLCIDSSLGATTAGCTPSGSSANYYTSTTFTGIGPTSFTPVNTLSIYDATATTGNTSVLIKGGVGQTSNLLEVDAGGSDQFDISTYGNAEFYNYIGIVNSAHTQGLVGVGTTVGSTGVHAGLTTAQGTSSVPILLNNSFNGSTNATYTNYGVSCHLWDTVVGTGTVTIYLVYTSVNGVETSTVATLPLTAIGDILGSVDVWASSPSYGQTPISYYTTYTGTGTYAMACTSLWKS